MTQYTHASSSAWLLPCFFAASCAAQHGPESISAAPPVEENKESVSRSDVEKSDLGGVVLLGDRPERAWVRPVFTTRDGKFSAGTGFVVLFRKKPFLFTAQHLFGPAGGLDRDYVWTEMRELVSGVVGQSPFPEAAALGGPPLRIAGARGMDDERLDTDLAVFPLRQGSRVHALSLSPSIPNVGQNVWLIGEVLGTEGYRHPAVVVDASEDEVVYAFAHAIELRATSGAPVVDSEGRVVAMNLAGGEYEGTVYGIGNPATSMRRLAESAMSLEQ